MIYTRTLNDLYKFFKQFIEWLYSNGLEATKKLPSLYVQTVTHLCISRCKGALFGVRWYGDVWRKVRCGG